MVLLQCFTDEIKDFYTYQKHNCNLRLDFPENKAWHFMWLYNQIFTWNFKPYFLRKNYPISSIDPNGCICKHLSRDRSVYFRNRRVKGLTNLHHSWQFLQMTNSLLFFYFFFIFFPQKKQNRIWHFMQIVSNGANLHEMSKPVFSEKLRDILKCHLNIYYPGPSCSKHR